MFVRSLLTRRSVRRGTRPSILAGATLAAVLVATPVAAQEEGTHTVESGDTLVSIAADHGFGDTSAWRLLFDANPDIDDPDVLAVGTDVRIPDPDEDLERRPLPGEGAAPAEAGADAEVEAEAEAQPEPATSAGNGVWDRLAQCESDGNWSINTGNGFHGGLQFHPQTWAAYGGTQFAPTAAEASRDQEIAIAERVQASQGWGAWPACASQLGLR